MPGRRIARLLLAWTAAVLLIAFALVLWLLSLGAKGADLAQIISVGAALLGLVPGAVLLHYGSSRLEASVRSDRPEDRPASRSGTSSSGPTSAPG